MDDGTSICRFPFGWSVTVRLDGEVRFFKMVLTKRDAIRAFFQYIGVSY